MAPQVSIKPKEQRNRVIALKKYDWKEQSYLSRTHSQPQK